MTRHEQDRSCSAGSDAERQTAQSHRRLTFRGRRGSVELLGDVLSIQAFLIRLFVGVPAIRTNHCGRDRDSFQASPNELSAIDIHSL